jgi:hypothetical protein
MPDPFTSLSIASAIFQILDFAGTLLERAYRIRKSSHGAVAEVEALQSSTAQLLQLSTSLDVPTAQAQESGLSNDQKQAIKLAESSKALSEKITGSLQELEIGDHQGKRQSLALALKLERQKSKHAGFAKELEHKQAEVRDFILHTLCESNRILYSRRCVLRWLFVSALE